MFYLTTHSNVLFTVIFGVRHVVKDPHIVNDPHGLPVPISSKDYFIYTIPQTG